jgi:1,4-dihydroxy-2-naphthoyl-CoA hydrolase
VTEPMTAPKIGLADASTFVRGAGLVVEEVSGTRVTGHLDLTAEHHTPWGVVHGGVYTSAIESAASIGASTAVQDSGQFAVGVHNATDFLRAMTEGRVDVEAVPVQQSRVQQLWDVRLTNPDGKLVARGSVRLQNVAPRG